MSKIRIKGDTSGYVDLETSATGSNLSVIGNALKVDAINEKTSGNGVEIAHALKGSGISGHVVQIVNTQSTTQTAGNANVIEIMNATLTTKIANSNYMIFGHISYGSPANGTNLDAYDMAFACGHKISGASSWIAVGNNTNYTRRTFDTGLGVGSSFYQTDVPFSPNNQDTHTGAYDVMNQHFQFLDTGRNYAAGTSIIYDIQLSAQGNYYINRSRSGSNGGNSSITIMEIAP